MEVRRRGPQKADDVSSSLRSHSYSPIGKKSDQEFIGFRHWLILMVFVGILYGTVVFLHRHMPAVTPGSDYTQFSEERARNLLRRLSGLGPRPSGSENLEKKAFDIVHGKLKEIEDTVANSGVNRLEIDVQRPTGCFDLKFLSSFTLCYHKVTNIIARIGPKSGPAKQALLLNCHYDTMPDTPGATDDAVSPNLKYSEENFLQGAHGFIEQHPWRYTIRAFINLEGTGSGGREILFQSGPGNSWLLQTYLEAAPHPHCSVMAQEIFQSGIIPSDTDFRIFRDHGHISGLDIAYTKNGWVYHTEFDEEWRIEAGAIQRAGENILAVVNAIVKSPYLKQAGHFEEANKWVFYDVVGLFTVYYSTQVAEFLNIGVIVAVLLLVLYRLSRGFYSLKDLFDTFVHHAAALLAMTATLVLIIVFVNVMDLIMCW
ncbi:hypothetical protein WR25_04679 [Diploscapter pachys]|uniref:FXNA-like protease n=1 Tax=Diploscapter pachys TaxID=2018661 RepID=A0A2A2KER2_9BILA|nr:hypothetical protein WR25_04679 [Diploscapter pachys]